MGDRGSDLLLNMQGVGRIVKAAPVRVMKKFQAFVFVNYLTLHSTPSKTAEIDMESALGHASLRRLVVGLSTERLHQSQTQTTNSDACGICKRVGSTVQAASV